MTQSTKEKKPVSYTIFDWSVILIIVVAVAYFSAHVVAWALFAHPAY